MPSEIDAALLKIKARIEAARQLKTRSEIQREAAKATVVKVAEELAEKFEIYALEEAEVQLNAMNHELQQRVEELQSQLEQFK